jgi:hypothetical protein
MLYPIIAIGRRTAKAITLSKSMLLLLLPLLLILASPISAATIPAAATAEVQLYSIWVQENETGGNADVFFAKSEDGGETFTDPINLSNNEEWSSEPRIAVVDNHVHVVWLDFDTDIPGSGPDAEDPADVRVRSSDDGGETFGDAVLVNDEGTRAQERSRLQIEATSTTSADGDHKKSKHNNDDSNVYISWVSGVAEEILGDLILARSDDSGLNFELVTELVSNVDEVEMEVVAAAASYDDDKDDADNIYFAGDASSFGELPCVDQIFFQRSTDGGETFDDPIFLEDIDIDLSCEEFVRFESMEADNDKIQVTWIRDDISGDDDPEETHFAVSADGGETWGG